MTIDAAGHIPQLTMGWRMKMALADAGIHVQDMAEWLEVDRQTVGRWLNDRNKPPRAALIAIHLRTGVPLEWLETGHAPDPEGDGGEVGADDGTRTRNILLAMRKVPSDARHLSSVADAA